METAVQQLQTAIQKITHQYSAAGDDAATLLAAFFDGSTLGCSLFHEINKKMQLTAKIVDLHDFTKSGCSPIQAVCLIVAPGLSRAKYRHLLSFASAKQQAYLTATGVCVPNLFPARRTVETTWKSLRSLCSLESPTWYNNTVSISWPLEEWLEYVQSQDAIWDIVADPHDGIARQKLLQNQLHHQHQLQIKKSPRNKQIRCQKVQVQVVQRLTLQRATEGISFDCH